MKKICILLSLFVGMISLFGMPQNSNAADNSANKSYSVQAVLPDNQLDKEVSYYDLKSEPNKEQNLEIIVANTGSEKITVETELNNAYTTDGATIGYDKFNAKTYKSDNPSLSSLIVGKRKIKSAIDAGQTKTIVFKIRHPKKAFDGIILGGITTTALVDSSHSKKVDVANQIRYVKGVVLHSKDDPVTPNMNLETAAPKSLSDSVGIGYQLNNLAPININDVSLHAVITDSSKKEIKYNATNLQIAPNSKFNYFIPIKHLKSGIYTSKLTFKSESGYEKTVTNKLRVTQGKIDALDESTQQTTSNKSLIMIIVGLAVVLFGGLWIFMYLTGKKIGKHKKK